MERLAEQTELPGDVRILAALEIDDETERVRTQVGAPIFVRATHPDRGRIGSRPR